ncbi:MAG: hypothetical protein Q9226_009442, partial [Calogaya cf. arnoldii]
MSPSKKSVLFARPLASLVLPLKTSSKPTITSPSSSSLLPARTISWPQPTSEPWEAKQAPLSTQRSNPHPFSA